MTKIAIVFHSGYGHTKGMAEAVATGANSVEGVEARIIEATEISPESDHWAFLDEAEAHIYGSPTYMGSISAGLKQFFEQKPTVQRWMKGDWKDKIAAGFSNSGSPSGDKLNTLFSINLFAMQMGMVWVGLAEPAAGKHGGNIEDVNRLGGWLGAFGQSPSGDHDRPHPLPGDMKTAESLGKRVAESALRWNSK